MRRGTCNEDPGRIRRGTNTAEPGRLEEVPTLQSQVC